MQEESRGACTKVRVPSLANGNFTGAKTAAFFADNREERDTREMEKPAIEGGTPARETKIYYGHQYIDDADIRAVVDVMKSENLTCGPKIGELEEKLCQLTGARYAVVCSNGTAALHMAALAAGDGEWRGGPPAGAVWATRVARAARRSARARRASAMEAVER